MISSKPWRAGVRTVPDWGPNTGIGVINIRTEDASTALGGLSDLNAGTVDENGWPQ